MFKLIGIVYAKHPDINGVSVENNDAISCLSTSLIIGDITKSDCKLEVN